QRPLHEAHHVSQTDVHSQSATPLPASEDAAPVTEDAALLPPPLPYLADRQMPRRDGDGNRGRLARPEVTLLRQEMHGRMETELIPARPPRILHRHPAVPARPRPPGIGDKSGVLHTS